MTHTHAKCQGQRSLGSKVKSLQHSTVHSVSTINSQNKYHKISETSLPSYTGMEFGNGLPK